MISKGRGFILVFVACVFVLPFVSAQAADELIAPQVYSGFQQQGAQLARDARELEAVLGRIKHKRESNDRHQAELSEFRGLRSQIKAAQTALQKKFSEMEASLVRNNADPIFIERLHRMAKEAKERFADLSTRLDGEDLDDLIANGLNAPAKRSAGKKAPKRASAGNTHKSAPNSEPRNPKPNIDSIPQPQKVELPDEPAATSPGIGEKFGLLQKDGSYQLVKFESSVLTSEPQCVQPNAPTNSALRTLNPVLAFKINSPRPLGGEGQGEGAFPHPESLIVYNSQLRNPNSEPTISPVTAWDLDLPQSVRPVMVAGLGDSAGLLSKATLTAIAQPTDADTAEDNIDVVFSPEIKVLADSLNKDPIRMYEYVKNNIKYQPYWGSLKGARQTLLEKQGNDCDQASLLIALLRYSGYPARYGEALVTVAIERAKQWLGVQDATLPGYLLASAGIPAVKDLYKGSKIVQIQFQHIYVEVYLAYENYRGQQRPMGGQKLWVPLSPAFKKEERTPGVTVPFDGTGFLEGLTTAPGTFYNPDGSLAGLDIEYIQTQMGLYATVLQAYADTSLNEFYGFSKIIPENYPILPITLPFESKNKTVYSTIEDVMHHRVQVQLSYWGVDLDEELETLEINYIAPTAKVAGKPLTLSYRPATAADEALLRQYDGNLYGTPLCLIHMYPQLRLGGKTLDENTGDDAAISMGLEETLRVKLLQPGEGDFGYCARQNDYKITVGDHVAIVPGMGVMPEEQLQESVQRLSVAAEEGNQDIDRLLGEQLHLTGSTYYYQTDTWYELIAKQAGVRWFRNPSDLIVFRHLTVDLYLNSIPVAVKDSTIFIDAPGNRFQAVPEQGSWNKRVAFLKTAGLYGSIMEHTVLEALFQQQAVSGVKLLNAAMSSNPPVPIYELTSANQADILPKLHLSSETKKIIEQELNLGQTVLAPAENITVGNDPLHQYKGAAVISSTPAGDPMGSYREGYLIARAADGGQIVDVIKKLLNSFVNPYPADWLQFQQSAQGEVAGIIASSDQIRSGNIPVRETLAVTSALAVGIYMLQQTALAMSFMSLETMSLVSITVDAVEKFLSKTFVMYIDFEGNPYYFPDYESGVRTVKFFVLDLLGRGVKKQSPAITVDENDTTGFAFTKITPTSDTGQGEFVFTALNAVPGDQFNVNLKIMQEIDTTKTSGTFYVAKVDMAVDGNGDGTVIFSDTDTDDQKIEFWVNNDYDTDKQGEVEDDGPEGIYAANCDDDVINTERDLEDFTRLHVSVEGILDKKFVPSYFFKFENITTDLKPEINIFEAVDKTLNYLDGMEVNNHSTSLKQLKKGKLVTATENDSFISAQYINPNDKSYFIFECKNEGKGDLVLVLKINGKEICKTKIEMTLRSIEKYYQKWTLSATDDDIVQMPSSFEPMGDLEHEPMTEDYVIYVHGWRMLPGEKKRWAETMFKRLWWQGYRGYFAYLDWPTLWVNSDYVSLLSDPENFDRSEYRAYQTGKYLAGILSVLKNSPHAGKVRILAHSMGNIVAGEAIRQLPDDGGYLLTYITTQPAVSAHAYDHSLPYDAPFLFCGTTYGPDTPEVLGSYFVNNRWKIFPGGLFRYFNIKDPALKGWEKNNFLKPDNNYHYIGNEVSYTPPPAGTDRFFKDIGNGEKDLTFNIELERYEILSRCVESRSRTLGSVPGDVGGIYDIDLHNNFEFGSKDYDHSRQFMSNIIREWPYWNLVMMNCMLK